MKTKTLNCLAASLGCLLIISSTHAQPNPAITEPSADPKDYGTLGHTYMALNASLIEYRNSTAAPTGYGSDFKTNIEASDNFDLNLGYRFDHAKNRSWRTTDQVATLGTTGFYKFSAFAPYLSVDGGYGWEHSRLNTAKTVAWGKFHRAIADIGTGIEVPVFAQACVHIGLNYEQAFHQPHPSEWTYEAAFDYNLDDTLGLDTGIDYQDGRKGIHDAIVYHAGVRFTFD